MDTYEPHSQRAPAVVAAALSLTLLLAAVVAGCMDGSPSPERTAETKEPLDRACQVLRGGGSLTVSVLGDSTGNDSNEWAALWAQRLGEDHQVTMLRWNDKNERWDRPQLTYGESGSTVRIWNFSAPGRTPEYASKRVQRAVPERPDLILFNYGHNNASGEVQQQYDTLLTLVRSRWASRAAEVVILQNPELGARATSQTAVRDGIKSFAAGAGVPVIDVSARFAAASDVASLMADEVHPNEKGSMLWAQTISSSLCMT